MFVNMCSASKDIHNAIDICSECGMIIGTKQEPELVGSEAQRF